MARPKKYNIEGKQVQKLASLGCSNVEIADFFGCDESLIRKSYSEFITKGKTQVKIKLRQAQLNRAFGNEDDKGNSLNDGNVSMLIWLGKQILGQKDAPEYTVEKLPTGFDLNEI